MKRTIGGALREKAAAHPERPYVKCGGDWVTLGQLDRSSDAIGRGLVGLGLGPGDRLAALCPNRIEMVELFFACAKTGIVLVPLNCFLKGRFLSYQVQDCAAAAFVGDRAGLAALLDTDASTTITTLIAVDEADDGQVPYASLRVEGPAPIQDRAASDLVTILYTSGTTGLPKGCMIPNGYYFGNADASRDAGWAEAGDRLFTAFPLFHMSGQHCLVSALANDASVCVEPEFSAGTFMDRAEAEQATVLMGVGPMGIALLFQPPNDADAGRGFRMAMMTPMPPEGQAAFEQRFNTPIIAEGYGQTEFSPATISPLHGERRRGTVGRAVPHCEVRIVDDDDVEVPRGTVGEIVLRPTTPNSMFSGYWNKPEATVEAFRNLWHHTGDFGSMDDAGFVTFVDRKKDALRRRGENVSSFELEMALARHPAIAQIAVTAVPSPLGEDDIKASVVFSSEPPEPSELFDYCAAELPFFAIPRYIDVRTALPVNALGRVQKHLLRDEGLPESAWDFEALGFRTARDQRR